MLTQKSPNRDCTVRMRVSPQARAKCSELPEFWEPRAITIVDPQGRKRELLTSLRERRRYKPSDIANCPADVAANFSTIPCLRRRQSFTLNIRSL